MPIRSRYHALAAAAALACAPAAQAVIVYGSSGGNTTAPGGTLANSGWQWQGDWQSGVFTATPVAPEYFVTAVHVGGSFTGFTLNGVNYTTRSFPDNAPYKEYGDLRLWRINGEFPSYAPLYNAAMSADGAETTKSLVVFGRGTDRGSTVTVAGNTRGWQWGADSHTLRWGTNTVASYATVNSANDMLKFNFDASGGANEAQLSDHDSGGGVFIKVASEYKLAGINYGATGTYRTSPTGSDFNAAIFNSTGLFYSNGAPADGLPGYSLASRISPSLATFTPWLLLPPTWKTDQSANWTTASAWSTGTVPNASDARADFRTVIGQDRVVTLNSAVTVGKISFDNANRYTVSGSGTITMDVFSGNATMQVASGSHTISTPITLNDSLNVNVIPAASVLTTSNQITATGKTINKQGDGILEVKNVRASALNVSAGEVKVLSNGADSGTSNVSSLSVTGDAKLNVTDNDVVVNYSGASPHGSWNGSAYTSLAGSVASAFNFGAWDGPGITTSNGAANSALTGVAIAEASDVLFLTGAQTELWSGQTVDATTVMLKYTYVGDLDLDGDIDGDDYFRIDSHILQSGSVFGYTNGDINLDGEINGDDYFWIDSNIPAQGDPITSLPLADSTSAGLAAVPEPATFGILAAAAILLSRRRRSGPRRCHSGG